MKVLFAVSNDNITTSVVSKYQQTYKEIITSKNVYYFNAIIKELQNDKTYDAIVIGEDLEPISNNNYEAIDKFLIEKLDRISDEASKPTGEDIPIIFICTERRSKSSQLLRRLFSMSIYNALIGNDRSVNMVCALINKPRNKKEAKRYYQIETDQAEYEKESEELVSEDQIQNILNYYKKIGSNETKCVEAFDSIANQYDDTQLRIIIKFLPMSVKAILESNSKTYQQLMTGGTVLSNGKYNKYKPEPPKNANSLEFLEKDLEKTKLSDPVVIPSTMNLSNVQVNSNNSFNNQNSNLAQASNTQQYGNMGQNYNNNYMNNSNNNSNNLYNNNYNLYNQQNSQYGAQYNSQTNSQYNMQYKNQITSNNESIKFEQDSNPTPIEPQIDITEEPDIMTTPINQMFTPTQIDQQQEQTVESNTSNNQLQAVGENSLMSVQPMPVEPVKRGRGRPRKNPIETDSIPKVKRGRGRPRKNSIEELSPLPEINSNEVLNTLPGVNSNDTLSSVPGTENTNDTLNRLLGTENTNNNISNETEKVDIPNTLPGIDTMSETQDANLKDTLPGTEKDDILNLLSGTESITPVDENASTAMLPGVDIAGQNSKADDNLIDESGDNYMNNFNQSPYGNNSQNSSANNSYGMSSNQNPYGSGVNNNQSPYGNGMNDYNQSPYGNGMNDYNQSPYGNGINNNQSPYGNGMNDYNQSPYGNGMNNNQSPYGNGMNNNQSPYGNGMNNNQGQYGNGMNDYNQNPYGNGMNNNQSSYSNNMFNSSNNSMNNLIDNNESTNNEQNGLVAKNGKVALFVGTTKNGTSFIVNNLAALLSNSGINTAIIDLTKNRNAYYMFTDNKSELMKIASNSLQNLQNGIIEGVKVNKNLAVYTGLPDDDIEQLDPKSIISNATSHYEIVLLDCDFTTDSSYYTLASEIYLVQSMDAFTIQPLTKLLSELKSNNLLDESKLRVIINKYVKTNKLDYKMIIGGMSKYNEPSMTLQRDIFNPTNIQSVVVPFEAQNYTKYIEDIAMCHLSLNGYSKTLVQSLEQLKNMVYPLIAGNNNNNNNNIFNQSKKRRSFFGLKKEEDTTFSNDMNSTLDKMRTNY